MSGLSSQCLTHPVFVELAPATRFAGCQAACTLPPGKNCSTLLEEVYEPSALRLHILPQSGDATLNTPVTMGNLSLFATGIAQGNPSPNALSRL